MADQASQQEPWLGGKAGCLSTQEQLKAWALREAWRQNNEGSHGVLTWIAEKLVKIGGGQPTVAAVKEFLYKGDKTMNGSQASSNARNADANEC